MTNIDFSSWRTTKANPNVFGKTIKIDGGSYSIEITRTNEGRGLWMFQRGQYDNQHGRFDKQIRSGLSDTFDDGYDQMMTTVHAYSSFMHDFDLTGWQRNLDTAAEIYCKMVVLGDRDYAVEIHRKNDVTSVWRITQGDAEVMSGKSRTLKDAFVSALEACENYEPPASHRF